jgi:hypothetical protein
VAEYLSETAAIQTAITITEGAAGTSDVSGAVVDTQGFDGVLAIVQFGAIVTNAVTSIKWQQGAAAAMGDAADLLASGQPVYDSDDNKTFYMDLKNFGERYVRIVVDRATQNATCSAVYVKYRSRKRPVTHGSNVRGEQLSGIVEGNAVIASTSPSSSQSPSASVSPSASSSPS